MKRIFFFISISIALLYVIREAEYAGVRKIEKGEFGKLKTVFLASNNYDMLIIGSSRAESQFYPPIIDSATGMKSFNAGMSGATMPFIRTVFEAYLVHSKMLKMVVLNLDLHSLSDNPDTVNLFPRYFPYLSNEKLYSGLKERDHRFAFFKWLPFYSMPYFGTRYLDAALHGYAGIHTKYDSFYESGFCPSFAFPPGAFDQRNFAPKTLTAQAWFTQNLDSIEKICADAHAKLVLVVSPIYFRKAQSISNYGDLVHHFRDYAEQHDNIFLDFSGSADDQDISFFNDPAHLNRKGALLFSRQFSIALTQYLPK